MSYVGSGKHRSLMYGGVVRPAPLQWHRQRIASRREGSASGPRCASGYFERQPAAPPHPMPVCRLRQPPRRADRWGAAACSSDSTCTACGKGVSPRVSAACRASLARAESEIRPCCTHPPFGGRTGLGGLGPLHWPTKAAGGATWPGIGRERLTVVG